jgi:hypothetical protein
MQFEKQFHGGRSPFVLTGHGDEASRYSTEISALPASSEDDGYDCNPARSFFGSGNGQWCASRNPPGIHLAVCSTRRHQSASTGSANT